MSVERSVRVHVLIDTLGVGGAEVLLTEFAGIDGVDLSIGYLKDVSASHTAERLRAIGRRIGVAGGAQKYPAVRAALRGGWINVLITDAASAHRLAEETV